MMNKYKTKKKKVKIQIYKYWNYKINYKDFPLNI